jgi:chorismate mutase / prephenate dehydratase
MTKDIPELRAAIDDIDDELVRLFNKRSEFVRQVGAIKKSTQNEGFSFIRSAREADMVRRMYEAFKGGIFPPAAAAHMWRIIISASLSLEAPLTVSAFCPEPQHEIYWLAREYFGNFTPTTKEPTARRVLGEVIDGKAQVGVLPLPDDSAEGKWWQKLQGDMKIFACVPYILPKGASIKALAVAKLEPEETGNDISFFSIETEADVSLSRLKTTLDKHKLDARWLATEAFASGHRVHLIEIRGFITAHHDAVRELKASVGASLLAIHWLGAYALPLTL